MNNSFTKLKHFIFTSIKLANSGKTEDYLRILSYTSDGLTIKFLYWHGKHSYLIDFYSNENRKETYSKAYRICEVAIRNRIEVVFKEGSFYPRYFPRLHDGSLIRSARVIDGPDGKYRMCTTTKSLAMYRYMNLPDYKELKNGFYLVKNEAGYNKVKEKIGVANIEQEGGLIYPCLLHIPPHGANAIIYALPIKELKNVGAL